MSEANYNLIEFRRYDRFIFTFTFNSFHEIAIVLHIAKRKFITSDMFRGKKIVRSINTLGIS